MLEILRAPVFPYMMAAVTVWNLYVMRRAYGYRDPAAVAFFTFLAAVSAALAGTSVAVQ